VDVVPPPAERDPDFRRLPETRLLTSEAEPERYQRLVANPFLGAFALIAWLLACALLVRENTFAWLNGPWLPALVLLVLASLGLPPLLLQYHCLDCGATGPIMSWKQHTCAAVIRRREEGRPRRLRGPTPPIQVILWLWAILAVYVVLNGFGWVVPGGPGP
jgi:hypothetical protein